MPQPLAPETANLLSALDTAGPAPFPPDLPALREGPPTTTAGPSLPDVMDLLIPGGVGIPARLHIPSAPAPRAALLWLHPGGFVAGDLSDVDAVCRTLADRSRVVVAAISYRLAPEHPYPAAFDDVETAWRWLRDHAITLAIDRDRIAVGGQSAGANLAAVLALRPRDTGQPLPATWGSAGDCRSSR